MTTRLRALPLKGGGLGGGEHASLSRSHAGGATRAQTSRRPAFTPNPGPSPLEGEGRLS